MNSLLKSAKHVVYIVGNQAEINHRLKGILSLRESFEKMVLITRIGPKVEKDHINIRPYRNPLGLFRIIGFHRTKKKLEKYFFFPSSQILYVWPTVKRLKKAIADDLQKSRKVTIITSLPPHDLSIIGLSLKTDFPDLYWIVDWQDLWSWDAYYSERVPKLYKRRLLNLEQKILTNCDINVTTNIKAKAVLEKYYRVPSEKIAAINHHFYMPDYPNGLKDHKQPKNLKRDSKILIGFLGTLFKPPKVPGSKVVEVIRNLRNSGLDLSLQIYGDNSQLARETVRSSQDNSVVLHTRTSHQQSLLNISQCQFLLLALSDSPNTLVIMHSKLPHYLLLQRPIIAIVPPNSFAAQLIRQTSSGYVIPTRSKWEPQLKNIIKNYSYAEYISNRNEKEIEKYSWERISKYWLQIIKALPVK